MKSHFRAVLLLAGVAVALPAFAYRYPLSFEEIRNAYFLGRGDDAKRAEFFDNYARDPAAPKTGPYIDSILLETPYALVVERAAAAGNYNAPQAEEEFLNKPAVARLYVNVELTDTYGWQLPSPPGTVRYRPDDFWRDFTVRLSQHNKVIKPLSVAGQPIYSFGDATVGNGLTGAKVWLEYDAEKIDNDRAKVTVLTPDGQTIEADFDLTKLK